MTVLVLGGTGTTGSRVAAGLSARGVEVRIGSRRAENPFEWGVPQTYGPALAGVERVYVVTPGVAFDRGELDRFVEMALAADVQRLVLLGSAGSPPGGPPRSAVLRPTWFMQNFIGGHPFARLLDRFGQLRSATGAGRLAFVDADDIAAVAVEALLTNDIPDTSQAITGPAALTYREAAAILSEAAGREIPYVEQTPAEREATLLAAGYSPQAARGFARLEADIASGAVTDPVTDTVQRITGRAARSLREFAAANASAWRR